jgi:uncharacterized protein (DUF3084 family)
MTEQDVLDQLRQYRQLQARIKILSSYSVGAGITVSRLNQDDQLQELHSRLRGRPSYMYLSAREEKLETVAHAYASGYPSGIKSQLAAIPQRGADAEDEKLLKGLRSKIEKVIAARGYDIRCDLDVVLERVAKLQDLQEELSRIDSVLEALEEYKPDYAILLKLVHVEGKKIDEIRTTLGMSNRTYWRRIGEAEREYNMLAR